MEILIGAIIGLVGTAVSMYSQYRQGEQQAAMSRYNETVARQQADAQRQRYAAEAEAQRRKYDRVLGTQRALYGASGVQQEGTPLLVMLESEEEAALDVARVRHAGEVAAHGLEAEAKLSRYRARQVRRDATLAMSGTLLTGLGRSAGMAAQSPLFGPTVDTYGKSPAYKGWGPY